MRIKDISGFILSRKLDELVRNHDADGKGFNADVFISRDFFRIKKIINIPVENVQVCRA